MAYKMVPVHCEECGGMVNMCPHEVPEPVHQDEKLLSKTKPDGKPADPYPNYPVPAKA